MNSKKSRRFELLIPHQLYADAQAKADELQISVSKLIKDALKEKLNVS